jgi:hypothetical protein
LNLLVIFLLTKFFIYLSVFEINYSKQHKTEHLKNKLSRSMELNFEQLILKHIWGTNFILPIIIVRIELEQLWAEAVAKYKSIKSFDKFIIWSVQYCLIKL